MRLVPTVYLGSYLASYALSMVGGSVVSVVLPVMILQSTGRGVDAGLVALVTTVPAVGAGLLLGAVTDRVSRRSCCVVADLVPASAVALALVSVTSGGSPRCAGPSGSGRSQGQIRVLPGGGGVAAPPDLGA